MVKLKASKNGKAHFVVSNLAKDGLLTTYCGRKYKVKVSTPLANNNDEACLKCKEIYESEEFLLKRGHWFASFLNMNTTANGEKRVERIVAGVYNTAQEAYMKAQEYGDRHFWKTPPETLVLELFDFGTYPSCVQEQVIYHYIKGMGYLDVEGITRPSYMLRQGLAEIKRA